MLKSNGPNTNPRGTPEFRPTTKAYIDFCPLQTVGKIAFY